jgi:hypothetical protein
LYQAPGSSVILEFFTKDDHRSLAIRQNRLEPAGEHNRLDRFHRHSEQSAQAVHWELSRAGEHRSASRRSFDRQPQPFDCHATSMQG